MTRCTEPERWPRAPGADAPEEEVESYLAHVGVCPFHAAIEQREEALVRSIVTLAGRDVSAHGAEAYVGSAESGHRLDAEAESRNEPLGRSLPVAAPGRRRARALSAAQRARHPSDGPAPARRLPARRLLVALCALAAVVLLALVLYRPTGQHISVVKQEQPSRPSAPDVPPPPPTPEATPSATDTQNRLDVAPATPPHGHAPTPPRLSQGGGRVAPRPRIREQLTVADVRRIYVGAGDGAHDLQLREALIERLRAGGRFIVVTGEQQADAVLLREQSRSASVSVQLVTRAGKTLWFTTQPTGTRGDEDVGDLAARIVNALTAEADKRQPPTNAPRR
ncbi:MAG: hypothetical protein ABW250_11565 [Pyrinomonadaceae bacterium]